MSRRYYHDEFNEIVIEVTDTHVLSDLWDFPERVPLGEIVAMEVTRERHHPGTLIMPVLALVLSGLSAFAMLRARTLSVFAKIAVPIFGLVFLGNGLAGLLRHLRNRRNVLSVMTRGGREGVLYFSQDDRVFRDFVAALLAALRARGGEMPSLTGGDWLTEHGHSSTEN